MIHFPQINPVAIAIGPLKIHWYGVAYVIGIILACHWAHGLIRRFNIAIAPKVFDELLPYAVIGIVVGGRLGHIMFWSPGYYLSNPVEILQVWHGGMSFHGGLLGVIAMTIFFAKRYRINFYELGDLLALISPIGLFFGRLANFINAEAYGYETNQPWGVVFPKELIARHPTQIYESCLEGLVLFIVLNFAYQQAVNLRERKGVTGCLFLCLYALFRLSVEPFKVQEAVVQLGTCQLGVGIILCILMLLLGILLLTLRLRACKSTFAHSGR